MAKAKDGFANHARLGCIARTATVCVMTLESWMKSAKPGETFDLTEPPSKAFGRREVIVLRHESQIGQKNPSHHPQWPLDAIQGRFTTLFATKVPDGATRGFAKAMSKDKGVTYAVSGPTPRLPRSRRRASSAVCCQGPKTEGQVLVVCKVVSG